MVETTIYRLVQESLTERSQPRAHRSRRVEVRREGTYVVLDHRPTAAAVSIRRSALKASAYTACDNGPRPSAARCRSNHRRDAARSSWLALPALDPADTAARDRDRAAAALAVSRVRMQQILDGTTAVIFAKDAEGRYELINRRYESLFHVTREKFIGKTDLRIVPSRYRRETARKRSSCARGRPPDHRGRVRSQRRRDARVCDGQVSDSRRGAADRRRCAALRRTSPTRNVSFALWKRRAIGSRHLWTTVRCRLGSRTRKVVTFS